MYVNRKLKSDPLSHPAGRCDLLCAMRDQINSIPITIVNSAPWWQPWLPVIASTVVAAATLIVMWRTLKANRAIEMDKWRRDALSLSLIKATEISTWCEAKYNARITWDDSSKEALMKEFLKVEERTTELASVITQLHLIRAHDAAYAARSLRNALHDAVGPVKAFDGSKGGETAAAFQEVLTFIRERQGNVVLAGQRELDGTAMSGDAAEKFYNDLPVLEDRLKLVREPKPGL